MSHNNNSMRTAALATPKEKILVDLDALRQILTALIGPPHHIRELQFTMDTPIGDNPIKTLMNQYNEHVAAKQENANGQTYT